MQQTHIRKIYKERHNSTYSKQTKKMKHKTRKTQVEQENSDNTTTSRPWTSTTFCQAQNHFRAIGIVTVRPTGKELYRFVTEKDRRQ